VAAVRLRDFLLNVGRVAFAATAVVAMTYQLASSSDRPGFDAGNFFSFFTIQSNILAAALLALTAIVHRRERTPLFDALRGAVTLYIAITGVVFALLLSGLQESLQTPVPWVDFIVHKLIPIVVVADWLIDPPRHRLSLGMGALWLCFPAAWLVYTLVRGASVDWYPYPFVDVSKLGYDGVLLRSAVLLLAFAAAAVSFVVIGNRRAAARPREHLAEW